MPIPPEEAKAYLATRRVDNWHKERQRRAAFLKPDVHTAFKVHTDGSHGWSEEGQRKRYQVWTLLEGFSAKNRKSFFDILAPGMADWMELAWNRSPGLPYQLGEMRKPFRAPVRSSALARVRLSVIEGLESFFQDRRESLPWYAVWSPYMETWRLAILGSMLGWAIDEGGPQGEEILQILRDIVEGKHREGAMGSHVIGALLTSNHPEAWALAERLLLQAGRQEGLRQSILETVDIANPQSFIRALRLIVEHNLGRFSSVWRAALVWGLPVNENPKEFNRVVSRTVELLQDETERVRTVREGEAPDVRLALWTAGYFDVEVATSLAGQAYQRSEADVRFNAILMVWMFGYRPGIPLLRRAIQDPDIKVASAALGALDLFSRDQLENTVSRQEVEALAERLPAKMPDGLPGKQEAVNFLLEITEDKDLPTLLNRVSEMSAGHRETFLRRWQESKAPGLRPVLLKFISDASPSVRQRAFAAIAESRLKEEEALMVEAVLGRKASDLRVAAMKLLCSQPGPAVVKSAERLLASSEEPRRIAGLELLADLHQNGHEVKRAETILGDYQKNRPTLSENERTQVERVLKPSDSDSFKLRTAFGLADFSLIPKPHKPVIVKGAFSSSSSIACIRSLDDRIHELRDRRYTYKAWDMEQPEGALGELPVKLPYLKEELPFEDQWRDFPLREEWEAWASSRSKDLRDEDGLELVRALGTMACLEPLYQRSDRQWKMSFGAVADGLDRVTKSKQLRELSYPRQIKHILMWVVVHTVPDGAKLALDAWETVIAECYERNYKYEYDLSFGWERSWRTYDGINGWLDTARLVRTYLPQFWTAEHDRILYALLRFYDEPEFEKRDGPGNSAPKSEPKILGLRVPKFRETAYPRRRLPDIDDVIRAFRAGAVSEVEVMDYLLSSNDSRRVGNLTAATHRKSRNKFTKVPELNAILKKLIDRIVEVSATRGDLPTWACPFAETIRSGLSLRHLAQVMIAAKGITWDRSFYGDSHSKSATFSSLVRHSEPLPEDTPERFKELLGKLTEKALVELAMYAPQWAKHVEFTIGWEGLEEAVWWMHAHTKDDQWGMDQELKEAWKSRISERTPLDSESLMNGAVDTKWFLSIRSYFDEKRWKVIDAAAKLASGGVGHKRAQRFADAMLGRATLSDLEKAIQEKRHQDSVRAYGLVPITGEADILARYQLFQKFLKESRQFGSMKQASEKLAVTIGMENLARTAGYPDPVRLQWAMEAREIEDLKSGSITAAQGDLSVILTILPSGDPEITAEKGGKPIKDVPATAKKQPDIKALFDRRKAVKAQAQRMRWSLESAMIRGDEFTAAELQGLVEHPVLAPMLRTLVFCTDRGEFGWLEEGRLVGVAGEKLKTATARLAHPFDFLDSGKWADWQREVFAKEAIQPFKQVFRELYVPTENELAANTRSQRYAGHQLQPRQALGVLGKRGWVIGGEEGVRKVMHEHRLVAHLWFEETFYTPADVEGLTLDSLTFTKTGDWNPIRLAEIPPRVFSETMRDLDLIVSVAHMGGYDPESSESSIEMRASVVRETVRLVGLGNVVLDSPRAIVQGKLGEYAIHLGSGNIHRRPGGEIVVVPVHSQHRGRFFLPFIDDDPKTAEIVSKVLLFAEDDKIQDPKIVRQILS